MTSNTEPKWKAAFLGKCPSCGSGRVFSGLIRITDSCKTCGIDFRKFETADGPAFFAISLIGTLVGILAGLVEVIYEPDFWVHLVLWAPFILIGSLIVIRISKTVMIAHQMKLR
jgi:uncharacterized protein (DUF983 family)